MASCGVGSALATRALLNAPLRQAATDSAPNRIRMVRSCAMRCFGMSPESQCSSRGPFHELSGVHSRETFVGEDYDPPGCHRCIKFLVLIMGSELAITQEGEHSGALQPQPVREG